MHVQKASFSTSQSGCELSPKMLFGLYHHHADTLCMSFFSSTLDRGEKATPVLLISGKSDGAHAHNVLTGRWLAVPLAVRAARKRAVGQSHVLGRVMVA